MISKVRRTSSLSFRARAQPVANVCGNPSAAGRAPRAPRADRIGNFRRPCPPEAGVCDYCSAERRGRGRGCGRSREPLLVVVKPHPRVQQLPAAAGERRVLRGRAPPRARPAPAPAAAPADACAAPCRTRFSLCLKEYQSAAAPGACSFGRAASPVLGTDSFTLAEPLYTLALPFSFRWTVSRGLRLLAARRSPLAVRGLSRSPLSLLQRSFTLILQAYDDYNYTEGEAQAGGEEAGLIEEAWWSGIVEPGAAWHALRHAGAAAGVAYRVRVSCAPNYHNTTCTTFCRARDDKFGHYSCDATGAKRCLPGWRGDNCEQRTFSHHLIAPLADRYRSSCCLCSRCFLFAAVCKEGCHPTHGRCDRPGDCE
ncbi:hypothetical protein MSG28_006628 [Choristoneura fumiferana]|uniref:Uncharacterized protein n=1 Tax=Choristoneura fumiferana TaxID=7141 RepID=A0ACC0JKN0_CHOFU|nr:hypothetical protein MSG28_006628 [Choristoneura fumiferana]